MKVTIAGGGNIGTLFAVYCAEKGHEVTIYTSRPELYDGHLSIIDSVGKVTHEGNIKMATSDPEVAFRCAQLIIVTMPAQIMKSVAEMIYTYSDCNSMIGVVPGNGGGECAFRKCIERGNVFFGLERVPAIARIVKRGKSVKSIGERDELHVAALPKANAKQCAELIGSIFDKRCIVIPSYLNLTMTPSNPILHTTRLKTLFGNWHEGIVYEQVPLFYEDWDDASSELLIACDEEVQSICRELPEFELQYVKSLQVYYDSPTVEAMTKKIASIDAFKGLTTPMVKINGGFIPDLHSRYFTSDFSYGLTIIKRIAAFTGGATPNIDAIISWYKSIAIEKEEFRFEDYGIFDRDSFEKFYLL